MIAFHKLDNFQQQQCMQQQQITIQSQLEKLSLSLLEPQESGYFPLESLTNLNFLTLRFVCLHSRHLVWQHLSQIELCPHSICNKFISFSPQFRQGCSRYLGRFYIFYSFFRMSLSLRPYWLLSIRSSFSRVFVRLSCSFIYRNFYSCFISRRSMFSVHWSSSPDFLFLSCECTSIKQLRSLVAIFIFQRRGSVLLYPRPISFLFISFFSFSRKDETKGLVFSDEALIFSEMNSALAAFKFFFSLEGLISFLLMQSMNWSGISAKVSLANVNLEPPCRISLIFMKSTISLSHTLSLFADFNRCISESKLSSMANEYFSLDFASSIPMNRMERGSEDARMISSMVSSQSLILPSVMMRSTQQVSDLLDMDSSQLAYLMAKSMISEILVGPCIFIFLSASLQYFMISYTPPSTLGLKQLPFSAKH